MLDLNRGTYTRGCRGYCAARTFISAEFRLIFKPLFIADGGERKKKEKGSEMERRRRGYNRIMELCREEGGRIQLGEK